MQTHVNPAGQDAVPPERVWEYLEDSISLSTAFLAGALVKRATELGEDRWELTTTFSTSDKLVAIYKRPHISG